MVICKLSVSGAGASPQMTRPRWRQPTGASFETLPESSRMPPSANEGLADQVFTRAIRRRRERVRELNIEVVRLHEGAHSRRSCPLVKRGSKKLSGPDPAARLAYRHAVIGEPAVHVLGLRRIDPRLAVDVERGDAVVA